MKHKSFKVPVFDQGAHDQYWNGARNQQIIDEQEAQEVAWCEKRKRWDWAFIALVIGCLLGAASYAGGWFF